MSIFFELTHIRQFFPLLLVVAMRPVSAVEATEIVAPGMSLVAAKVVLAKHSYEVDSRKHGLAMVAGRPEHALDFCRIDENTTLVITYRQSNKTIESLGIVFISERAPKLKRQQISREVLEIGLEDGQIYTLKFKRQTEQAESNNSHSRRYHRLVQAAPTNQNGGIVSEPTHIVGSSLRP